jgi:hypothetical protein
MAKPSPFQALVDRQLDEPATTGNDAQPMAAAVAQAPDQPLTRPVRQSGDQSVSHKERGKSSNPDYQRLTVYLRRDTILDLKRRIVGTNVELSDIVQDAVDRWINRPDVK